MKGPIVIRTFRYRAGGRGWVRYEIWGVPDGRTVEPQPAVRRERPQGDDPNRLRVDPAEGRQGADRVPGERDGRGGQPGRPRRAGRVIHSDTYRTHYVLWNGMIEIGR